MEHYSTIKWNEILPFAATWMDQEDITLSGTSEADRDKYYMVSLIMWNLKNKVHKKKPLKKK